VAFFRAMDIALAIAHRLKARIPWLSLLPLPEKAPSGSEPAIPPPG
jgi:hypothetical protein